ncbi:MAG: hypothetical protein AB1Z23_06610 [Eubacteriales bacterium]
MDAIKKLFNYEGTEKFVVVNSNDSLVRLTAFSVFFKGKELGNISKLLDSSEIYQPQMEDTKLEEILKSSFISRTLSNYHNTIFVMNLNCGFKDKTNAKVFYEAGIFINGRNYHDSSPIETIMHELGHIFHFAVTEGGYSHTQHLDDILSSEEVKNDIALQGYWLCISDRAGENLFKEQYADLYMISYLYQTSDTYEKHQIYSLINDETKKIISEQFEKYYL